MKWSLLAEVFERLMPVARKYRKNHPTETEKHNGDYTTDPTIVGFEPGGRVFLYPKFDRRERQTTQIADTSNCNPSTFWPL